MKITIFGTGYVGLVTGTCLAEVGHDVMCVDIDSQKISDLQKGIIPIYEPGLTELVEQNYKNGRLVFSSNPEEGVLFSNIIFSAVGTPPDENHRADLRFVKSVAKIVAQYMTEYTLFINKSTVPVGTGKACQDIISKELKNRKMDIEFDVVSNPEFLREGTAIKDFMVPDRIVCGIESEKAKGLMKKIYEPFSRSYVSMIWTDIPSAEIAKYAANAFLATKLSFINEIANFAELSGGNIKDISKAIGSDKRIGSKFLHAGIGYGGSCFPKDVDALIETGKDYGYDFQIIKATELVNKSQQIKPIEILKNNFGDFSGKVITLWGLSFKPKTDDIRDAPSLKIIDTLIEKGVSQIRVYDPISMSHVQQLYNDCSTIYFSKNSYDACKNSDALIIITEWDEFRGADKNKILANMKGNYIIDARNIWSYHDFTGKDVIYTGIGTPHR